jgi:RNA polymerase sigma-70 factor (ECF subfamily)
MEKDKIIISKVLNGEGNSFEEIIERYNSKILSFVCKMGIKPEDSEDVAQEVFVKAYNNLYRYNVKWEFSTWLFTIAINVTKDLFKSQKVKSYYIIGDLNILTKEFTYKEPLDNIERKEFIQDMFKVLENDVKAMLILFYYMDLPHKEIANIFNTNPDVVKMKIHRARKKLCDQFGERWESEYSV